ncbi:MAG: NUDIX domain-containing protein [Paludibacteraceae bacterium]|nr:NUDIX domain-containing protein [Paludibacteraceae bacterium]
MHYSKLFQYCPVCGSSRFVLNNEKSLKCSECDFVLYVNPSSAVAAFVMNQARELLVCRRAKEPAMGTLDLPGGFVDGNETAEMAVAREIKEELGAETITLKYLFSLPNEYLYSGLTIPTLDMFYECSIADYENIVAADDVAECFFVPLDALNPRDFGLLSIKNAVEIFRNSFVVK